MKEEDLREIKMTNPPYRNTPTEDSHYDCLGRNYEIEGFDVRRFLEENKRYLEGITEKTVLDLGCGFGSYFIALMKAAGYNPRLMIHLDANPGVFSRVNRFGIKAEGKNYYDRDEDARIVGEGKQLPLLDSTVDIVHQNLALANSSQIAPVLFDEVHRVLKVGGIYIVRDVTSPLDMDSPEKYFDLIEQKGLLGIYRKN